MEEKLEAQRLINKFGYLATDVVDEIIKFDNKDSYFWNTVKSEIWKIERDNRSKEHSINKIEDLSKELDNLNNK